MSNLLEPRVLGSLLVLLLASCAGPVSPGDEDAVGGKADDVAGVDTCAYLFDADTCADSSGPVCSCNGLTYPSACDALSNDAQIAHEGPCATMIRGKVQGLHEYTDEPFPLVYKLVTLYQGSGDTWDVIAETRTGPEGMYYFYDIIPGTYWLQVLGHNYRIEVQDTDVEDIQPILLEL